MLVLVTTSTRNVVFVKAINTKSLGALEIFHYLILSGSSEGGSVGLILFSASSCNIYFTRTTNMLIYELFRVITGGQLSSN